ncbi:prolyl aminopeptidase [Mycoplasma phocoeninasale]|uniref:Proline iminopeptidase n=1 Tax=Mycoplasma phocoeninasale TaxID=2726117 RepID=A0A858U6I0_9MOLU|nr:prolyl aminopeptidase [Mycoplasma phocoeninasale]QJG66336.1 prolyl aminopeptidase [Mycoplasma phocoeninasale]
MKLYDPIEPYNSGYLKVDKIHDIYYEEVGNPNGIPILFIHGGPGGGISESSRQYFDPKFYRVILFDQRGCGKSTPSACIKENTTMQLVNDIEKIREKLNIDKFILFGGSWGSALSLIYAINFPERVAAMILRGVFLAREEDDIWLYQGGASYFFPQEYEEFVSFCQESKRSNIIAAYHELLNSENREIAENAAYHWAKWELGLITLNKIPEIEEILADKKANLELARLENHYFYNHIFLEDRNYILNNTDKIKDIKTIIVHGRYDMDCRPIGAYLLHKKMKNSDLRIIAASGHSTKELKISEALVDACEEIKTYL